MPNSPEPLRLPPADGGWTENLWIMLGALLFGAMLVAAGIWTAPALISDWRIRDAARPLTSAEIRKGKCTSRLMFHICDARRAYRERLGVSRRQLRFTGVEFGDHAATVMADPARSERATTDTALDRLWNRTFTLLLGAAVLLAFTVLPLVTVEALGSATHGVHVHRGVNAIDRLRLAMDAMVALCGFPVSVPDFIAATFEAAKPISQELSGAGEAAVLSCVTVNLGHILGGV